MLVFSDTVVAQFTNVGLQSTIDLRTTMPVISMFYGVVVLMYYFDNRQHKLPHIHVKYGEEEAVLTIPDGEILEGSLRANKLKLVQAWVEIHREDLMANWDLAINGQSVFKIEPLR